MSRNEFVGVGWDCSLAAMIMSKVARDNGITTRAQLNTFIGNGANAVDKAYRRMMTCGAVFQGETAQDFAAIAAGVTE